MPELHDVHEDPPVVAKNVPAVQFVHTDSPELAAIIPAEQDVHTLAPEVEYLPASQLVHAVKAVDPP